jgi:hypothetical protein
MSRQFPEQIACDLACWIAQRRWLTISDIGVGETRNRQSLQVFLACFGSDNRFLPKSGSRKNKNP